MSAFLSGLLTGLSLIVAIGAQNAFVLRQGLRRQHVFASALFCAASDAVLIALGVAGIGAVTRSAPWLMDLMRWGGAAFLIWYGLRAARAAFTGSSGLTAADGPAARLGPTLAALAAMTWLNPHVWLDTLVLLGTVSARYGAARWHFAAGAMTGSFLFFFGLAYGARLLAPVFARPAAWRVLDALIAAVMFSIAAGLVLHG